MLAGHNEKGCLALQAEQMCLNLHGLKVHLLPFWSLNSKQTGVEPLGISLANCDMFWRAGERAVKYASGCTRNAGQSLEECVSLRQTEQRVIDLASPVKHSLCRSLSLRPQSSDLVLAAFRRYRVSYVIQASPTKSR